MNPKKPLSLWERGWGEGRDELFPLKKKIVWKKIY